MKGHWVSWKHLRPGDLFQSRDDAYPLRVLAVHFRWRQVVVYQGMKFWTVQFRREDVRVLRFAE